MEKGINLKTAEFKENLYKLINESELPIVNIYMIFDIVKHELDIAYAKALSEEKLAYLKIQKRESKDDNDDLENWNKINDFFR